MAIIGNIPYFQTNPFNVRIHRTATIWKILKNIQDIGEYSNLADFIIIKILKLRDMNSTTEHFNVPDLVQQTLFRRTATIFQSMVTTCDNWGSPMTLMKPPWKCCIPPKGRIDKVFSWFLQFTENVLSMFCPSNWCLTVWPVVQCLRDPLWVQDFFHPQYGVCRKMVYTPYTPPQNGKTGELGQDRLEVRWEAVMFLFNVVNLNVWLFLSVNLAKCVVEVVVIMFGLNEGDNCWGGQSFYV